MRSRPALVFLAFLVFGAPSAFAEDPPARAVVVEAASAEPEVRAPLRARILDYSQLAVGAVAPTDGDVGFDYRYRFSRNVGEEHDGIFDSRGRNWALNAAVDLSGIVAATPSENALTSHLYQIQLGGHHYSNDHAQPLNAREQARIKDILNKDPNRLSRAEFRTLRRFHESVQNYSRFWAWDAHGKAEASQDFASYDLALGAGLAFDLASLHPELAAVFDSPFALLRSTQEGTRPDAPRIYLGYDFVTALDQTAREATTGARDDNGHRFTAQVAWSTRILTKAVIKARYVGHYEVGAPKAVETSGRDINHFGEAQLLYPLREEVDLVIEVKSGRLPPDYGLATVGGAGFTLRFGDIGVF